MHHNIGHKYSQTLEKKCTCCGFQKTISHFYIKKNGYLGVDSKCKKCVLNSKSEKYQHLKKTRKGIIEILDVPEEEMPKESIVLILKLLGF